MVHLMAPIIPSKVLKTLYGLDHQADSTVVMPQCIDPRRPVGGNVAGMEPGITRFYARTNASPTVIENVLPALSISKGGKGGLSLTRVLLASTKILSLLRF